MDALEQLFSRGLEGELAPIRHWLAEPRSSPLEVAYAELFEALLASAMPQLFRFPVVGDAGPPETAPVKARGLALGVRRAVLEGDSAELDRLVGGFRVLPPHPEVEVRAAIAREWQAYVRSEPRGADASPRARALGLADALVEATSLFALGELEAGALEAATLAARTAVRMASAENHPLSLFLAAWALARARRRSGLSHLTERILSSLARVMPSSWRAFVEWELCLALGVDAVRRSPESALGRGLVALYGAALAGDVEGFVDARARLAERTRSMAPFARDLEALASLAGVGLSASTESWCTGETHAAPFGLATGLGGETDPDEPVIPPRAELEPSDGEWGTGESRSSGRGGAAPLDRAVPASGTDSAKPRDGEWGLGCVLARPRARARRLAAWARPLYEREARSVAPSDGQHLRTEVLLATLALCPEMRSDEVELFRRVYGFELDRVRHQRMWDVLMHRARKTLEPAGRLERVRQTASLELVEPVLLRDPRCAAPVESRVLSLVARKRGATAKELAQSLGLPLRSLQEVVKELVDRGVCQLDRQGRNVVYRVEDTTFREPTWVRELG